MTDGWDRLVALTRLSDLTISGNTIATIPTVFGSLTNLVRLHMGSTKATGTVPTELALLTLLTSLTIAANSLTGTLIDGIWRLPNLKSLQIDRNALSGTLPSDAFARATSLETIFLASNLLSGKLPLPMFSLSRLNDLALESNNFTGPWPTEVAHLTALKELTAGVNPFFGGPLPTEFARLTGLEVLRIENMSLAGVLPDLRPMASLTFLNCAFNRLQGTPQVPPLLQLGRCTLNGALDDNCLLCDANITARCRCTTKPCAVATLALPTGTLGLTPTTSSTADASLTTSMMTKSMITTSMITTSLMTIRNQTTLARTETSTELPIVAIAAGAAGGGVALLALVVAVAVFHCRRRPARDTTALAELHDTQAVQSDSPYQSFTGGMSASSTAAIPEYAVGTLEVPDKES